ncbi:hypothetical protein [Desulfogranum mediterraneum]|nr:hypothetical protein [Desulfogranum mediterraneum]
MDEEFGVCTLTVEHLADRRNNFHLQSAGMTLEHTLPVTEKAAKTWEG